MFIENAFNYQFLRKQNYQAALAMPITNSCNKLTYLFGN